MKTAQTSERSAFVLLGVLIVILLASMVAVSLMFRMRAEEKAAGAGRQGEQAWLAALSGLAHAMALAASQSSGSSDWMNDPALFREQLVLDDGAEQWFFTVYSYGPPERAGLQYGLTDEASRLDLHRARTANLIRLPKITPVLVQSLRDFVDPDGDPRPEGAEQESYHELPRPILVPNEPPSSLDQILLVRGFNGAVFFGEDANLNHELDPNEDDGETRFPPDDDNGALDRGLRQYLTVWAYDPNVDNEGLPRVNVNDPAQPLDGVGLPEATVAYLTAMRQAKLQLGHPAELLEAVLTLPGPEGAQMTYPSGVGAAELALVLDKLCATNEARLPGLININTASIWVLQTVLDHEQAEEIVNAREYVPSEKKKSVAWLFTEGILDAPTFRLVAPWLTARSYQFRCQIVGYSLPSGHYRILEVSFDVGTGRACPVYLRDITRLGPPFPFRAEELGTNG